MPFRKGERRECSQETEAPVGAFRINEETLMTFRYACPRGHQWERPQGDAAPTGLVSECCPTCGSLGAVVPQMQLERTLVVATIGDPPPLVELPANVLADPASQPPRNPKPTRRKRITKGRAVIAALIVLTILSGM